MFLILAAMAASAAPLLVYSVSLALFGLPHVLVELRYVDERFNSRIGTTLRRGLLALLSGLFLIRLADLDGFLLTGRGPWELVILVGLAGLTLPALWRAGSGPFLVGALVMLLVGAGILTDPAMALVILAVLHNVTPVGFLAERLEGRARHRAMLCCVLVFGLVPTALATGVPGRLLDASGLISWNASLLDTGPLTSHLSNFVPAGLISDPAGLWMFSAAVYLQVMHYVVVLHVLPRLQGETPNSLIRWPQGRGFQLLVGIMGALFFVGFALSFGEARAVYGIFAAIHAWVEIPILLVALTGSAMSGQARTI